MYNTSHSTPTHRPAPMVYLSFDRIRQNENENENEKLDGSFDLFQVGLIYLNLQWHFPYFYYNGFLKPRLNTPITNVQF